MTTISVRDPNKKRFIYSMACTKPGDTTTIPGGYKTSTVIHTRPGFLLAFSNEEAENIAWGGFMRAFPTSEGYTAHCLAIWGEDDWPDWMKTGAIFP